MQLVTELTKELKARLERLYAAHERIDLAIESLLEGRRGGNLKLWADDLTNPALSAIAHGSFTRFAGEPAGRPAASALISRLKTPLFVQPSPAGWIQLLEEAHGERVKQTRRYRLWSNGLRKSHLVEILRASPWADSVRRLEKPHAKRLSEDAWGQYHFPNCAEPQQLVEKGMGFCIHVDDEIVSCCSSILTSRTGHEVNIITKPAYRRQGMAMAVAARFVLECLEKNLEPHWDGANEASKKLAVGLGYIDAGTYSIYYVN
jgi:hypothetical protein